MKPEEFVTELKQNKLYFDEKLYILLSDYIIKNMSLKNITSIYTLAKRFGLSKFAVEIVSFMRKCFTISVKDNWLEYPETKQFRLDPDVVFLKQFVYSFGGGNPDRDPIREVQKYSFACDKWSIVTSSPDDRRHFCVCAFESRAVVIGGCFYNYDNEFENTASCWEFDAVRNSWKELAEMKWARNFAACAVFKNEIVVSGGEGDEEEALKSVEAYDERKKKWRPMPDMNMAKEGHCMLVVEKKLFVIGEKDQLCEVFDEKCNKFSFLKSPKVPELNAHFVRSVSIGNKIIVFGKNKTKAFCYDITTDKWSEMAFEFVENMFICKNILSTILSIELTK